MDWENLWVEWMSVWYCPLLSCPLILSCLVFVCLHVGLDVGFEGGKFCGEGELWEFSLKKQTNKQTNLLLIHHNIYFLFI